VDVGARAGALACVVGIPGFKAATRQSATPTKASIALSPGAEDGRLGCPFCSIALMLTVESFMCPSSDLPGSCATFLLR
jgi:hypothetical protein